MRRALALLLVAAGLAGCGGTAADDVAPQAWLGEGRDTFEARAPGETVSVFLGPQGGYMTFVAYRVTGIAPGNPGDPSSPDNPRAKVTCRLGTQVVGITSRRLGLKEVQPGLYEGVGTVLVFDPALDPSQYLGHEIEVALEVVDTEGHTATASVTVTTALAGRADLRPRR